jgi:hypothetical protein
MACASELLASRPGVAADTEALYLLHAVRASCTLLLTTIQNVLDLKALETEAAATGAAARRSAGCPPSAESVAAPAAPAAPRHRVALRALLAEVLDACRIGCSKDIAWTC